MDLSVVIPTHGGNHRLPRTLEAIATASAPAGGAEVVIVDDGSPDPIVVPPDFSLSIVVVRCSPNRGRAAACNHGAREAQGRVLLVLDDDMTLAPGALAGHVAAHHGERTPLAVVGRIDPDPASFTGPFGAFLVEEEGRRRARLLARAGSLAFSDCLTGHFSIRRETLLDAGGYDASFSRYGFEDIELAYRLGKAGVALVYRDDLVAVHRSEHAGFRQHCRRHLESGAMARVFAESHPDPEVRRFLRADGMRFGEQGSGFLRAMALAHGTVRLLPRAVRSTVLGASLAGMSGLQHVLPRRLRHAGYHLVRDLHYAAGIESGEKGV